MRLTTLAEALEGTERFVGLHFFSPANVMKLVEIGPIAATSPDVVETMRSFCQHIGKVPVEVGDHPGYLVNRLLVPYILHAIETLEEGVAGPEAIDTAMKLGCAHPMGPLALADHIGLDVVFAMSKNLYAELGDPRYRCPTLLRRLVLAGSLGKKTGAGFYDYAADRTRTESEEANALILEFADKAGTRRNDVTDEEILERLLYPMINEAGLILEEGIAQRASDIDVMYVHGYGWPSYTGGPMFWASTTGLGKVVAGLEKHADKWPDLKISTLLKDKAAKGEGFA